MNLNLRWPLDVELTKHLWNVLWPKILIQWSINRPRRVVGHVVQVTMIIITWIEYMSFHVAKFYGYCNYMDHSAGCLTVPILKTSIPLFSSSFLPSSPLSQLRIPWSKASDRSLFYCYILLFIYVENVWFEEKGPHASEFCSRWPQEKIEKARKRFLKCSSQF